MPIRSHTHIPELNHRDTENTERARREGTYRQHSRQPFLSLLSLRAFSVFSVSLWFFIGLCLPGPTAASKLRSKHPAAKKPSVSRAAIKAKISTVNKNIHEAKAQLSGVKQD